MRRTNYYKSQSVVSTGGEATSFVLDGIRYHLENYLNGYPEKFVFDGGFYIVNTATNEKSYIVGDRFHFFSAY